MKREIWTIFVDGASRGNPGDAGAGIYVSSNGNDIIKKGFYLGTKTNNQAEYLALALSLFLVKNEAKNHRFSKPKLNINSDSELLIKQMLGIYRVRNSTLQKIKQLIEEVLADIPCSFTHIRRNYNKTADSLANDGIDQKHLAPKGFIKLLEEAQIT